MDNPALSFLLRSIGFQTPQLLVYLIGLILAAVFIRRCQTAAILTLVAMAVLLVATLGHAAALAYLIQANGEGNMEGGTHLLLVSIVNIARGLAAALGLAFLVSAVFVGRKPVLDS